MTMALCKQIAVIRLGTDLAFTGTHFPGECTPRSGIYRCDQCGSEVAANRGEALPNDHRHAPATGVIRWRLIVAAEKRA